MKINGKTTELYHKAGNEMYLADGKEDESIFAHLWLNGRLLTIANFEIGFLRFDEKVKMGDRPEWIHDGDLHLFRDAGYDEVLNTHHGGEETLMHLRVKDIDEIVPHRENYTDILRVVLREHEAKSSFKEDFEEISEGHFKRKRLAEVD